MKVTKLIREYITGCVYKAYPLDNLPEYVDVKKREQEAKKVFFDKIGEFANSLVNRLNETYALPTDHELIYSDSSLKLRWSDTVIERENKVHRSEIEKKRREKIAEILLQLELGANREELNRILSDLLGGETE